MIAFLTTNPQDIATGVILSLASEPDPAARIVALSYVESPALAAIVAHPDAGELADLASLELDERETTAALAANHAATVAAVRTFGFEEVAALAMGDSPELAAAALEVLNG